jgi:hypothetical protein
MVLMFYGATDFDKDVIGWNVCKVLTTPLPDGNFAFMFDSSGQPGTTLEPNANGACIACPANSTSGSGEYVRGQNPCNNLPCLDNGNFNTALGLWFSNPTLAESTYGNITDW